MKQKFEYCVSIRTVGKAGEKYIRELESLHAQTIPPRRIIVRLAEGFERPKEQVGIEEYVTTPKGLVHQRCCSADGVDTEFLLVLDDDVYLPPQAVERLHADLLANGGDCIAPDTFPSHRLPWRRKLAAWLANEVRPHHDARWAIKIGRHGTFSYLARPRQGGVYPTQSAAGPAFFCRTAAFRAIHYEDELFVDAFPPGTYGEDQLNINKFYRNGMKVLLQYDSGILHLDAGTNNVREKTYEKLYYRAMSQYITWYRSCCDLQGNGWWQRLRCSMAYGGRFVLGLLTRLGYTLLTRQGKFVKAHVMGNLAARRYVRSQTYRQVPNFILSGRQL